MSASPLGPVPGLGYAESLRSHAFVRLAESGAASASAAIAEEVPIAIAYNNAPFVVVMASPADLEDLGVGFSFTEGVVSDTADIIGLDVVRHSRGVELQMRIADGVAARLAERRRGISARTGCGVCGIESIDEVLRAVTPVVTGMTFRPEALWRASEELEQRQPVNAETRAVHAAAFADASGALQIVREDVGRHNALDKVVGSLIRSGRDPSNGFVVVTSRASYELVQKTAAIGVPLLAAVSRPTGLAIQLADRTNLTLVGLLRGRTANVYSHPARLTSTLR